MLHPRIKEVTQRVIERSKQTRQDYLDRISVKNKKVYLIAAVDSRVISLDSSVTWYGCL